MASNQSITPVQRIEFHDEEILSVRDERTGVEYVLPKPIVEALGFNWTGQSQRIKRNPLLEKGVCVTHMPSAGGEQETVIHEAPARYGKRRA